METRTSEMTPCGGRERVSPDKLSPVTSGNCLDSSCGETNQLHVQYLTYSAHVLRNARRSMVVTRTNALSWSKHFHDNALW